jgi:aldose 1-epimerase
VDVLRVEDEDVAVELLPEAGARLHRLTAFGVDLLRTPDDPSRHLDDPFFWGAYVMAPWANRVDAEPTVVAGRTVDLPANFFDGTAIHGQVYVRRWSVTGDGMLEIRAGGDGWPWPYRVEQRVAVHDRQLEIRLVLTNDSDAPMPGGLGLHPWFSRPIHAAIRGAAVHPSNVASRPEPEPVAGDLDRRILGPVPDGLDAAWTDLDDPPVTLEWPAAGVRATLHSDALTRFIVAASPADLEAVAIEPQTHAPDAIRRLQRGEPGGLALIEPGGRLAMTVLIGFERLAGRGRSAPDS